MGAKYDLGWSKHRRFTTQLTELFHNTALIIRIVASPMKDSFKPRSCHCPHGLGLKEVNGRLQLLESLNQQRATLAQFAETESFDRLRQGAISLLTEQRIKAALDVTRADDKTLDRYAEIRLDGQY